MTARHLAATVSSTMKKLMSCIHSSKQTLQAAAVAVLCLSTGFAHAPFANWATGQVIGIDPPKMTFVVRDDADKESVVVRWNETTRLWTKPIGRHDRGIPFEPSQIANGAPVQIMFKKYSDHNLVTRVIRLAPNAAPHKGSEFPDVDKTK